MASKVLIATPETPATPRGYDEMRAATRAALTPEDLAHEIGIHGLNWLIGAVLDEHYPADIFGDGDAMYPSWTGERGGDDIDPGIKWVALLRHAIKVVR